MKTDWEKVADDLYKSLKRTPYYECGELDHSGGFYHKDNDCPVIKMLMESMDNYEKFKGLKTRVSYDHER